MNLGAGRLQFEGLTKGESAAQDKVNPQKSPGGSKAGQLAPS